jgi:hypothetical protein
MSKEDKFVIVVNGGLFNGELNEVAVNVFSRKELDEVFEEWNGGEVMVDEDGEEYGIDDLIELGSMGEKANIVNESMVEMSDVGGWVEVSIVKLDM